VKKFKRKKDLLWLTVLEVSVHDQLASFLLSLGEVEHHGEGDMVEQSYSLHGDQKTERITRKGLETIYILQRHILSDILPSTSSHVLIAYSVKWWINPLIKFSYSWSNHLSIVPPPGYQAFNT
jgi:hypothetical protein